MRLNIIFLLILIICAGCMEWAPKDEYEIFSYLPNQNISRAGYITMTEKGLNELSSLLGELMYGGILKKFKEAKVAFIIYVDEERRTEIGRGTVVYLKTDLSIDETLKLIEESTAELLERYGSYREEPRFKTEKKVILGKEITIVEYFFAKMCLWKEGEWIKMVWVGFDGRYDCEETLKEKYDTRNAKEFLKKAEEIKKKIKKEGVLLGEGIVGASSREATQREIDVNIGVVAFGDESSNYLIGIGSSSSPPLSEPCDGEIAKRNGKEACFASGGFLLPFPSGITASRIIGNYAILVMAHPKELKSKVEKRVEDIIFSIELPGEEVKWKKIELTPQIRPTITGLSAFGVEDFEIHPDGQINFYLVNNKGFRVNITNIYIKRYDTWRTATLTREHSNWISPGARIKIDATNTGLAGNIGDVIASVPIAIEYRVQVTGEIHNDTGMMSAVISD